MQRLSRQHAGHVTLALRRTHPRLYRTLVRKSIEEFARIPETDRPLWRAGVKEWRFPNGSVIEFGHAETDEDVGQYLSAEYDCIAFDEQTEFTQHQYDMIGSRARTTAVKRRRGVRPHIIGATNPGQVGHEWNRETFVLPTDYGALGYYEETFTDDRTGLSYERRTGYVHATVLDNPHADPDYVGWLLGLPDVERKRYLYGDWDVFEGLYFDEWDRDLHVVHSSTDPINPAWPARMAVDYGSYAPFCALWGAWDQDGVLHIYRELYKAGTIPDEQARMIVDAETDWEATAARGRPVREKVDMHLGDPSMWDQSHRTAGVGMTIYDQYVAGGVPLIKAKNARLAGWARVKQYLRRDSSGRAGVVIHGDACPNLVRTMPLQRRDEKRPEDVDTEGEDHACVAPGTLVETARGAVPIRSVVVGDMVWTRCGLRRVLASGVTGVRRTWRIGLSSGRVLEATPDHLVWADGWRRVDTLRYGDSVAIWPDLNESGSMACGSGDTPTPTHGRTATTSFQAGRTGRPAWDVSTKRYGKRLTVQSRQGTSSTTSTRTRATTTSRTSRASHQSNTRQSTHLARRRRLNASTLNRSGLSPRPGIRATRAGRGTQRTGGSRGLPGRQRAGFANTAARRSTTQRTAPGSVPTSASRRRVGPRGSMTRLGSVKRAAVRSGATGTCPPEPVPDRVVALSVGIEPTEVWNLKVEGEPEFFAGGVLVHNCDAFRYLCMSQERRWNEPTPEPVREPGKVYDRPAPRRGQSGWHLAQ